MRRWLKLDWNTGDLQNCVILKEIKATPGLVLGLDDNLSIAQNDVGEKTFTDISVEK